jgi:hypothetical protein
MQEFVAAPAIAVSPAQLTHQQFAHIYDPYLFLAARQDLVTGLSLPRSFRIILVSIL